MKKIRKCYSLYTDVKIGLFIDILCWCKNFIYIFIISMLFSYKKFNGKVYQLIMLHEKIQHDTILNNFIFQTIHTEYQQSEAADQDKQMHCLI